MNKANNFCIKVMESHFIKSCASITQAPQIKCVEIAILGRSNVGKSSLINALLNRKNIAKSSSTPGKTRLVNFFESKWQVTLNKRQSTHPLPPSAREGESLDCFDSQSKSRNGNSISKANSKIFDEIVPQQKSTNEAYLLMRRSEADLRRGAISQKAEFTIRILDFPGFGYAKVSKAEKSAWDRNLSVFLRQRESIKLYIHLIDARHTDLKIDSEIDIFLHSLLRQDTDILEIFTKADKLNKSEAHALNGKILVSILQKNSVNALREAILAKIYHF